MAKYKVVVFASLFVISSLFAVQGQERKLAVSLAGVTAEVTPYGILTSLKKADGEDFFGKGSPPIFDGYALAYYANNPQTGKQELRIVFANSRQVSKDSLILQPGQKPMTALVKTGDGIFEILTEYKISVETGELRVVRRFKNVSKQPVEIVAIEEKKDERIAPGKSGVQRLLPNDPGHYPYSVLVRNPRACGEWICPEDLKFGPGGRPVPGYVDPLPDSVVSKSLNDDQAAFEASEIVSMPLREQQRFGNITVINWHRGVNANLRDPVNVSGKSCQTITLFGGHQLAAAHKH